MLCEFCNLVLPQSLLDYLLSSTIHYKYALSFIMTGFKFNLVNTIQLQKLVRQGFRHQVVPVKALPMTEQPDIVVTYRLKATPLIKLLGFFVGIGDI